MTLITSSAAAQLLDVAVSTVKRWADDGTLPSVRTAGGHRRFEVKELEKAWARIQGRAGDDFVASMLEQLLGDTDTMRLNGALIAARAALGSWWKVAEQLGHVITEMGNRWQDGACSIIDEHIATRRLETSIAVCTAAIHLDDNAPRCLLATAEGEDHTLGLSLAELCLREAGWRVSWAGTRTPSDKLIERLNVAPVRLLCLSASIYSQDARILGRHYRIIASACSKTGTKLILGGQGAWPDQPRYGYRIRHFEELHALLETGRY